jgi:hypothetical protein
MAGCAQAFMALSEEIPEKTLVYLTLTKKSHDKDKQ